jgi:protein arginine kinase activator
MKCQRCTKAATIHITEVTGENQFDELHLCEDCAQRYLYEPQNKPPGPKGEVDGDETAALNLRSCPHCGLKFGEFRNAGRLGCPHDYEVFRTELVPLLENVHGETRHAGKTPNRRPGPRQAGADLLQLRKDLQNAVNRENYEEAAKLRDRIRQLEEV